MQNHHQIHLHVPSAIADGELLPWDRLWTPFGGSITLESFGFNNDRQGFLVEPSKYSNTNCLILEDWISESSGAWVLCGSQGTGKTGAIIRWLKHIQEAEPETTIIAWTHDRFGNDANFFVLNSQSIFSQAMAEGRNIVVVIDGFDQFRTEGSLPFGALTSFLTSLPQIGRLRVVIACRSRDWNHLTGGQLINLWKNVKKPRVLEVCPLRRSEIEIALKSCGISTGKFFREVFEKRLESAAHWPLTLGGLLNEFSDGEELSGSVQKMFSKNIDDLLRDRKKPLAESSCHSRARLLQSARRVAALTILGGFTRIARRDDAQDGLTPESFCGSPSLAREVCSNEEVFQVNEPMLHSLLGTSLFTVFEPPTNKEPEPPFGFVHQNYAEFLAAEYLVKLTITQLQSLLTVDNRGKRMVPGPLVETASWLAVIRPDWFDFLVSSMPAILVRTDGNQYSDTQKAKLIESLSCRAEHWEASIFDDLKLLNPSFYFQGLEELLEPIIQNSASQNFSRRFAIEVVSRCRIQSMEDSLWRILENQDEDENIRYWAMFGLNRILEDHSPSDSTIRRLTQAMKGQMGPDENDNLKGMALSLLVPKILKPFEVVPWITLPKNPNHSGLYEDFLKNHLPDHITLDDLEAFLSLGASKPSIFHTNLYLGDLPVKVVGLYSKAEEPTLEMTRGFLGWVTRCIDRNTSLPLSRKMGGVFGEGESTSEPFSEEKRMEWLRQVAVDTNGELPWHTVSRALRLRPPLKWALDELNSAKTAALRKFWATGASRSFSCEERSSCLDLLTIAYEQHEELREQLRPSDEGMTIHETYCALEKQWALEKDNFESEQNDPDRPPSRQELVGRYQDQWKSNDERAWVGFCWAFTLNESGYPEEFINDISADWEEWNSLAAKDQTLLQECAREFLLRQDDPRRANSEWAATNWSEAGALAVILLLEEVDKDPDLAAAVSEKWLIATLEHLSKEPKKFQKIASIIYGHDPNGTIKFLERKFKLENDHDSHCQRIELVASCWDSRLSNNFSAWLKAHDVSPATFRTGIEFLASNDLNQAIKVLESWLDNFEAVSEDNSNLADTVLLCAIVFSNGALFERAFPLLGNAQAVRRIFSLSNGHVGKEDCGLGTTLKALNNDQVGQLAVLLANAFPNDGDSNKDDTTNLNNLSPEQLEDRCEIQVTDGSLLQIRRISDLVIDYFSLVATYEEIENIRPQFPAMRQADLAFSYSRAQKHTARSLWKPVRTNHLLKLVQSANACFIRTNDDLQSFLMERLRSFDEQPWDRDKQALWIEPKKERPFSRDEPDLSSRIKRWLDESKSLVVNREVQPIETGEDRLDLKVDIPGVAPLCVVIELKKVENQNVRTDVQTQLVDRYLVKGRQTHGIYLVAWFGDKPAYLNGDSLEEKKSELQRMCNNLNKPSEVKVEPLLLDMRHPKLCKGQN